MRFAQIVISAILAAGTGDGVNDRQTASTPPKTQISYSAFMALSDKQRWDRFDGLDAETKSMLMRTHAQRWLEKNRQRLSRGQIELVQEMIAYLSPETASQLDERRVVLVHGVCDRLTQTAYGMPDQSKPADRIGLPTKP